MRRIAPTLALALVLAAAGTAASAPGAPAAPVSEPPPDVVQQVYSPQGVSSYWTNARITHAKPEHLSAPGADHSPGTDRSVPRAKRLTPRADANGYAPWPQPYKRDARSRISGKLVFTSGTDDTQCSASVVRSRSRSLVVTAAHCAWDPEQRTWSRNLAFIPGADDRRSRRPYGIWPVTVAAVPRLYMDKGPSEYDVAVLTVAEGRRGRHVQDVVGAFTPRTTNSSVRFKGFHSLGYPADAPYDGERLMHCLGNAEPQFPRRPDSTLVTDNCHLYGGNSGGPWIHRTGKGPWEIIGVTSTSSDYKVKNGNSVAARLLPKTFGVLIRGADQDARRRAGAEG
ncbi:trypsin-like peptidase domain-containing protein [Streptomyces sp. NPDC001941]|uniref:trypsin-like serine peptidase n=1 Tax=Streptomyces sp. NPDC001941 TaxID=3154659 RepID=UPI00332DDE14